MRLLVVIILLNCCTLLQGQQSGKISTMDFVAILDQNTEEARYYYQNNWWELRVTAKEKGYIHSFEILERPAASTGEYDLVLITTYANPEQFEKREEHFQEIISARDGLKLLNAKQPAEFRKSVYSEDLQHWE